MKSLWAAFGLAAALWPFAGQSVPLCEDITYQDSPYTICTVDLNTDALTLFLQREDGRAFGHFSLIDDALADDGKRLSFGMNAGMYHSDRAPVGLYTEDGTQVQRLITSAGPGNFGLLPNGVLCLGDGRADVFETLSFEAQEPDCRSATQSGPMLVIDGALHPRFLVDSTSRFVRNGVGTHADGKTAVFAISNSPVTFHQFGSLFRDLLQTPNALYFDGNISRLHAPQLGRSDIGFAMGPIIGTISTSQ